MKVVDVQEAETTLSQLVEQVERGEQVVLARAGTPVARLVPLEAHRRRKLGGWRGRVQMSADFDAPLPADELVLWTGE